MRESGDMSGWPMTLVLNVVGLTETRGRKHVDEISAEEENHATAGRADQSENKICQTRETI